MKHITIKDLKEIRDIQKEELEDYRKLRRLQREKSESENIIDLTNIPQGVTIKFPMENGDVAIVKAILSRFKTESYPLCPEINYSDNTVEIPVTDFVTKIILEFVTHDRDIKYEKEK